MTKGEKWACNCGADCRLWIAYSAKFHVTCPMHPTPAAHGILIAVNSNSTKKLLSYSLKKDVRRSVCPADRA